MPSSRYRIFQKDAPHFVTCTAVRWIPIFARPDVTEILLQSLRFLCREGRLSIYAWVVMENHLHLVVASHDLVGELRSFKSYTARTIIDFLKNGGDFAMLKRLARAKSPGRTQSDYQVWKAGSHPLQILGREMLLQKIEYIHTNPVRRGYVDVPEHWRYSSARDYCGVQGLLPVELVGW